LTIRVHLVANQLTDLSTDLASVGDRHDGFPLPHGRGDELHHGSPGVDPRSLPAKGSKSRNIYSPDLRWPRTLRPGLQGLGRLRRALLKRSIEASGWR
jgi:hypothetical protein